MSDETHDAAETPGATETLGATETHGATEVVEVADITVDRVHGVSITWSDGFTGTIPLEDLRTGCPCAACRGPREQGVDPWPRPGQSRDLTIIDAELVGAWGLSVRWNDGHDTGIYPWDSLRRWLAESPDAPQR